MKETFDPFVEEGQNGLGPRGGVLNQHKPAWRNAKFNGTALADGSIGQHRFDKGHDSVMWGRKNEQPWHTMAAYMLNAGLTNSEIAMAAGVTAMTVSQLRGQKWFQEKCAMIANRDGEELVGALKSYALEAIEAIHEIATDDREDSEGRPLVNARTKLAAHLSLLEHAHGKPVQKVVSDISHRVAASPTEEMEAIQSELSAIRKNPLPVPLALTEV